MPSTTVVVGSAVGLHARPATIIAEAAADAAAPVTIALEGGEPVDAGSALLIMTLGAEKGASVVVTSDDQDAVDSIAKLIATDLDAE
ncbi:MAG: HPr family phosphocarrier protein [Gordonia sp. (in: high G+C Gram-positive bacteria)]